MKKYIQIIIVVMGMIFPAATKASFTVVSSGDWSDPVTWGGIAPSNNVLNEDIIIPDGMTLNLDQDVTFTGMEGVNSFLVDGTLSNTSENGLIIFSGTFSGSGVVSIKWITFKQLASTSFSGLMNVKNFVNEATLLSITNNLNVLDTLDLQKGMMRLDTSGELTLNMYSVYKVDNGSLTLNGGVFNRTYLYDVMYVGSSKTTGIELDAPTLHSILVRMDDGQVVTLDIDSAVVHGNLVMTSGNFLLNGKRLRVNGSLSQNISSRFIGDTNAELSLNLASVTGDTLLFDAASTANYSLKKLVIGTADSGTLVLGSPLIIENELSFLNGRLELSNYDLTIMPDAAVTGYSDTQYVVTSQNALGSLVMNVVSGAAYTTFPVGTSAGYSPVYIQQNASGTSGNFNVRAMNTVLSDGSSGTVLSEVAKVVDRTWFIGSATSSVNSDIKLGWLADAEVNDFDRTNAYISAYASSAWDNVTPGSAVAGANNTYELTRSGITALGPFAVVEDWTPVKINELSHNDGMEIYPNPAKDVVNIKMSNSPDNYRYELVDLTGRIVFSENNKNSYKFNISDLATGCYFVKVTNLTNDKTVTKRIIKE